ncbi:MAG: hypothetical protein OQK82_04720 [Candidatus Pacearchaeota archaeon]|nr:hypothetical protein [Candidatus Pacearchaeota archaeon]
MSSLENCLSELVGKVIVEGDNYVVGRSFYEEKTREIYLIYEAHELSIRNEGIFRDNSGKFWTSGGGIGYSNFDNYWLVDENSLSQESNRLLEKAKEKRFKNN